eukprot:GABW01000661.1.p1 GENE.GABW01000661.1~~GABW01000661.1.p1  ORF type:complete len:72 (+),score=3.32 GABW01000661.1:63-278(+)
MPLCQFFLPHPVVPLTSHLSPLTSHLSPFASQNNLSSPHMYVLSTLDDIVFPVPDGMIVNVDENESIINVC